METTQNEVQQQVNPSEIMQIGMGFWSSKVLLTAVNLDLFSLLSQGPKTGNEIKDHLNLHGRGLYDFLDTLVALGFLKREGMKDTALYSNAESTGLFLDKNKPSYIGGILAMANNRLYKFWDNLEEGLKTGRLQNEAKVSGRPFFEVLYESEERLKEFMNAMSGVQMGNFIAFAKEFDFSSYQTHCDIGGASGSLAAQIALHNPHMKCISFDLPAVQPVAAKNVSAMNVADRVTLVSGDFFTDDFPKADIVTMGNILHDWGLEDKKKLIKKAFDALPQGGAFAVIENIIDNERKQNAFGLMMSLNMLIETEAGFDFSAQDFEGWAKEAGFSQIKVMPLTGPASAVIAYK